MDFDTDDFIDVDESQSEQKYLKIYIAGVNPLPEGWRYIFKFDGETIIAGDSAIMVRKSGYFFIDFDSSYVSKDNKETLAKSAVKIELQTMSMSLKSGIPEESGLEIYLAESKRVESDDIEGYWEYRFEITDSTKEEIPNLKIGSQNVAFLVYASETNIENIEKRQKHIVEVLKNELLRLSETLTSEVYKEKIL